MTPSPRSFLLTDFSSAEVERHLQRDRRLIVPVGACDQYGPHLPIGSGSLVAEAIAATLARDFAILRAPTLQYGVNLPSERMFAGTAGLHEKTLHRVLNDLLSSWEDHGFSEFILLTAHNHDPHVDALAGVSATRARVRVIEVLGVDFSQFLEGHSGPEHGGEALTSLMLYLHPDKVNLASAVDAPAPEQRSRSGSPTLLPADTPGSTGKPTLASSDKGREIFEYIVQRISAKVFIAPPDDDD